VNALVILGVSGATAALLAEPLLDHATRAGVLRSNYRGRPIPVVGGLLVAMAAIPGLALAAPAGDASVPVLLTLAGVTGTALVGAVDDLLGTGDSRGFRGHLGAAMRGRVTTGLLKAVFGGLMALALAGPLSSDLATLVVNALFLALAANTLNLLDLRPGRALKAFWLAGVPLGLLGPAEARLPLAAVAGAAAVFTPLDLRARAMLGDAGANVLGLTLGLAGVWALGPAGRAAGLILLAGVHAVAEVRSLNELIESHPWLRAVDRWGRSEEP